MSNAFSGSKAKIRKRKNNNQVKRDYDRSKRFRDENEGNKSERPARNRTEPERYTDIRNVEILRSDGLEN